MLPKFEELPDAAQKRYSAVATQKYRLQNELYDLTVELKAKQAEVDSKVLLLELIEREYASFEFDRES